MADIDSERDRRVRELLSNQSKKKDQFAVMNQAQSEVGDIQSELRNHLAMEQAQDQARLQEAQTISQAAQGMMEMEGGDQLQGQVSAMNPQTQAALGKFGVKPGRTQNTSRNQASNRVVTKSGDTTNIKNENITNNHTEIKVTQPTIPMSQPTISVRPQQTKEDNTSKFKAWLSGMFAKQQNEAEIQKKEYRKKEWNLGRTTSRLMKRIEDATSGLSSKLDPKNMTSTLGGQLKWLLLIFGATMMSKFWKPTMKFLANLEGGFRAVFGLPMNNDLRQASSGTLSVIDQIKDFIGIKKGENESLIGGIGKVFMEGIDKLIDKLKFWFEDRASALKEVEFPSIETPDFGPLGKIMAPIMEGLTDTFKGLTQYIGDLITVAMGGSKGKVKVAARKISRQAQDVFTDTTGKQTSAGDSGLVKGKGRNYMKDSDYDTFGNLKSNASSTQAMSRSLVSMFNDRSGKAHTAEIGTGVGQLFDVAKRNGQVVIDPELLGYLGLTQADVIALQRNKQLRQDRYRIIGVKPTTDAQRKEMGAYTGNGGFWTGGAAGTAAGAWGGAKLGAMAGGAAASFIPGLGTAVGAGIGGTLGFIGGAFAGGYTGSALGAAGDNVVKNWTTHGLYPKLVKADSGERGADGSLGVPKMMWVLTKEGADAVTAKFTHGMTNKDMDITNKEFYNKIRKIEERKKRHAGVTGPLTQNLSTNDLQVAQSNYDAYNREWNNKFESNDPNSENMKNYGHWNSFMTNASNLMGDLGRLSASGFRSVGNWITTERLSGKQVTSRSNYLMNELMKEGLTRDQAAGVAGNIMRESGFATNKWGDHGTSTGIAQWHNERITNYNTKFGASGNLADASYEDQVRYLIWEAKQNGTLAAVKRARNYTEATNIFERKYEVSADYGSNGNRYRINYAGQALNSFNDSSGNIDTGALQTQNTSMATFYKGSSPYELNGETSSVGGSNIVAWIGDSHSELGLPGVVGSKLKAKFGCQFVWGAYHGYSACSHLKNKPYNGVCSKDNKVNNLSELLKKKPSIVIVELGTNDANGVDGGWKEGIPKLIDTIKGNGGKVIWITPFGYSVGAKNAKKNAVDLNMKQNQVRNYILSRSDISVIDAGGFINFYSGQSTPWDKFVGSDGIHWNRQGYKLLGEWIGGILTGVVSNPNFSSEDLEKQDGLFGAFSKNIENVMESLAGGVEKITGNDNKTKIDSLNLSDSQKTEVKNYKQFLTTNTNLNQATLEGLGAKVDRNGIYFESNGYRGYIDPSSTSGIFGIDKTDIQFVGRVGKDGKLTTDGIDHESIDFIKNSISINVNSLTSNYSEKNSGSTDFMTGESGKKLSFPLGSFKDLNFTKPAIADFEDHAGGGISYFIYPSKDRSRTTMIGIGPMFSGSPTKIRSTHVIWSNYSKGNKETDGFDYINRVYGPIMYHKGAKWYSWGTLASDRKYTEIQPICEHTKVWLTPMALKAQAELFDILSLGKLSTNSKGQITDEKGNVLTDKQLVTASRYGVLNSKITGNAGSMSAGVGSSLRTSYFIKDDVNSAQDVASGILKNSTRDGLKTFLDNLGINDKTSISDYYNKNKNLFEISGDKLIGAGGIQFGVFKNGKLEFFDYNTILKSNTDQKTLKTNFEDVKSIKAAKIGNIFGVTDLNSASDFIAESEKKYRNLSKQDIENMKKDRKRYTSNKSITISGFIKYGYNSKVPYQYNAYLDENGEVERVSMTDSQLQAFFKELGKDNIDTDQIKHLKNISSPEKLNSELAKIATDLDKSDKWYKKDYKYKSDKSFTGLETGYNYGDDKYLKSLLSSGKKIIDMDDYGNVKLEDGTKFKLNEEAFKAIPDKDKFVKEYNARMEENEKNKLDYARQTTYGNSRLYNYYKSISNQINTGQLSEGIEYGEGNKVYLQGKQIGTYTEDKNGNKTVTALSDYKVALNNYMQDVNRDPSSKISAFKRLFGAVVENGGIYVYSKKVDKDGHPLTRVELDVTKSIPADGNINLKQFSKSVEFWSDGKWQKMSNKNRYEKLTDGNVNEYYKGTGWMFTNSVTGDVAMNNVLTSMQQDLTGNKKEDVTNKLLEAMADDLEDMNENSDSALVVARNQLIQQAKTFRENTMQTAYNKITALSTKHIAENGITTEMSQEMKDKLDNIEKVAIKEANTKSSKVETEIAKTWMQDHPTAKLTKFTIDGKDRYYDRNKLHFNNATGTWEGTTLSGEEISTKQNFTNGGSVEMTVGGTTYNTVVNNYNAPKPAQNTNVKGHKGDGK